MAIGSDDVRPHYNDLIVKNTFIDILERAAVPVLKRSRSAPPGSVDTAKMEIVHAAPVGAQDDYAIEPMFLATPSWSQATELQEIVHAAPVGSQDDYSIQPIFLATPSWSQDDYKVESILDMSSHGSSNSSNSHASSNGTEVLVAPATRVVRPIGASYGEVTLLTEPRQSGSVALSEVLKVQAFSWQSIGSIGHAQGFCKTCLFENRARHKGGSPCTKGVFCERCHEDHGHMARRKPKTGRQRERQKLRLQDCVS